MSGKSGRWCTSYGSFSQTMVQKKW